MNPFLKTIKRWIQQYFLYVTVHTTTLIISTVAIFCVVAAFWIVFGIPFGTLPFAVLIAIIALFAVHIYVKAVWVRTVNDFPYSGNRRLIQSRENGEVKMGTAFWGGRVSPVSIFTPRKGMVETSERFAIEVDGFIVHFLVKIQCTFPNSLKDQDYGYDANELYTKVIRPGDTDVEYWIRSRVLSVLEYSEPLKEVIQEHRRKTPDETDKTYAEFKQAIDRILDTIVYPDCLSNIQFTRITTQIQPDYTFTHTRTLV